MAFLSCRQLLSFQVLYDKRGSETKLQWYRAVLVIDFAEQLFQWQYKERVLESQRFSDFKDVAVSSAAHFIVIFSNAVFDLIAQNAVERSCLRHLLECIRKRTTSEDAIRIGHGLAGLDAKVMNSGFVYRKTSTRGRKEKRFLVLVPGKLFVFKSDNTAGRHARDVTSLLEAIVMPVTDELEICLLPPNSREVVFVTDNLEDFNLWMESLHNSIACVNYAKSYATARDGRIGRDSGGDLKENDLWLEHTSLDNIRSQRKNLKAEKLLNGADLYYRSEAKRRKRRKKTRLRGSWNRWQGLETIAEEVQDWAGVPGSSTGYCRIASGEWKVAGKATSSSGEISPVHFEYARSTPRSLRGKATSSSGEMQPVHFEYARSTPRSLRGFRRRSYDHVEGSRQRKEVADSRVQRDLDPALFRKTFFGSRGLSATDLAIRASRRFYDCLR